MTAQAGGSRDLYRVNVPGVIAGIAFIVLPFLGIWWRFAIGDDAVVIATSPFHVLIESFGTEITSPLLASLNLGLKIIIVYYGLLLVAGSVLRVREDRRPMADFLVRVSARKFLWLVLLFVISVAISDFAINQAFTLSGLQAQVPYFTGNSVVPLQAGGISLRIPVTQGFTGIFFIAILVAIVSLAAHLYQGRLTLVKTDQGPRFRRIMEQPAPVSPLQEETEEVAGTRR
jgi:hypothetical protein